jgi:hypothetical protein
VPLILFVLVSRLGLIADIFSSAATAMNRVENIKYMVRFKRMLEWSGRWFYGGVLYYDV